MPQKKLLEISQTSPTVGVIAGDNLFTYILSRNALNKYNISSVVLSNYSSGSAKQIISIFKKTSIAYFIYRAAVQIVSKIFSKYSIQNWAKESNVPVFFAKSKQDMRQLSKSNDITLAFNFDIIVPEDFIERSKIGVLNIHASNLPLDKGISPVVWAYCRGDHRICISYYLMDGGIDSGEILKKVWIEIGKNWSLFRTYCEVLDFASKELITVIDETIIGSNNFTELKDDSESSYNSWPNSELHRLLTKNSRKYFSFSDFSYLNRLLKNIKLKSTQQLL